MIERSAYLEKIKNLKDKPQIKIITGIRHSGKSFLFYQLISDLKQSGVEDERIIHINFESPVFDVPRTAREIDLLISEKSGKDGRYYIFFDEIQTVSGWQRVLNTLLQRQKFDIYVSVSDSSFLSKNGSNVRHEKKYMVINFKPVSFAEYKQYFVPDIEAGSGLLNKATAVKKALGDIFGRYIRYGGFPAVCTSLYGGRGALTAGRAEAITTRIKDIYSSILLHDVIRRENIRNTELLEHIVNIVFLNIGKENSPKKITENLTKKRYTKNLSLVYKYLKALENAFVVKKIPCCNLLTGKLMSVNAKYFAGEHSLLDAARPGVLGASPVGIRHNILAHELERREYAVYSGKFKGRTVDFVAKQGDKFVLLQTIDKAGSAENSLEQKTETLRLLNDMERFASQKKYVIFLEEGAFSKNESGDGEIQYFSLYDFLSLENI
jgi:predicted AAA+ superfamily ATPase